MNAKPLPSTIRRWMVLVLSVLLVESIADNVYSDTDPRVEQETPEPARPNIVLILADDLGWTDLSCRGSEFYDTPNIDRLAEDGLTLTSFYTCQNCAPTRAALMSGQYGPRTGVYTVGTPERGKAENRGMIPPPSLTRLPLSVVTFADCVREAGYVTGMYGKWHLGNQPEFHPGERGFDEAITSNGRHFNIRTNPTVDVDRETYHADFVTNQAIDFINRHQSDPFLLYVAHFAVHTPIQAKEDLIEVYRDRDPVGGHNDPVYAAMIHSVDESVGRIVQALEENEIAENTLIIFMSDNGGLGGYTIPGTDRRKGITDNFPLRGGKGNLYEGGVRVPWIASWPAKIPAGSESTQPAAHVDLYPTFLELAGAAAPDGQPLDGVSLVPLLTAPDQPIDDHAIYSHFPGYLESYIPEDVWRTTPVSTIRDGDFKLLEFFEDGRLELYNLREDLGETNNLIDVDPDKAAELHLKLRQWRNDINAPMPIHKSEDDAADREESCAARESGGAR